MHACRRLFGEGWPQMRSRFGVTTISGPTTTASGKLLNCNHAKRVNLQRGGRCYTPFHAIWRATEPVAHFGNILYREQETAKRVKLRGHIFMSICLSEDMLRPQDPDYVINLMIIHFPIKSPKKSILLRVWGKQNARVTIMRIRIWPQLTLIISKQLSCV